MRTVVVLSRAPRYRLLPHGELETGALALRDEGAKVLATFRLTPGPGGPCRGRVQVRYTIVGGRFTEWRQLDTEPAPEGPVV